MRCTGEEDTKRYALPYTLLRFIHSELLCITCGICCCFSSRHLLLGHSHIRSSMALRHGTTGAIGHSTAYLSSDVRGGLEHGAAAQEVYSRPQDPDKG